MPQTQKTLRLWPGVVAVALQWLIRYVVPVVAPDVLMYAVLSVPVFGLATLVWWAFFSRAPRLDRWLAIVLLIAAPFATYRFIDKSIATGMMGLMFPMFAIPVLCLAFVLWAVAAQRLSDGLRRTTMVATILLASGAWTLLRTNGITGAGGSSFAWRWAQTAEQRLLAHANDQPVAVPLTPVVANTAAEPHAVPAAKEPAPPVAAKTEAERVVARSGDESREPVTEVVSGADWPGFRGPHRDSIIPGVRIETDWAASPPVELWRRPVGPGWSSFAVHGDLFYTQEQRGQDEVVSCYSLKTGQPVWRHGDAARFWESNGGAGPRATPTLNHGRVYTFGATGIVSALDARTGAVVWTRNAGSDTGTKIPEWGFASSPLVMEDLVIVAAAGTLVAYEIATGTPRWVGPNGHYGYSSPHPLTIDGVAQILLQDGPGVTSVSPVDGKQLWEYTLPANARIVQPALTSDGDLIVSEGEGNPVRRIAVAHGPSGWTVEERWKSMGLKPYFNDFVIHDGHAFGFDGGILSCIDLKDGKRKWKGGRYGSGQLVLFSDQDVLLVLSEEGELALVAASTDQYKELARFPAIEGKTWNHPALAGDVLLVRNGEEMAAFRLSLARR